jgi:CBS domain-containing protein
LHNLAVTGRLMDEIGTGFLPVLGDDGRVLGVVTDRDLCLALTTRDLKPSTVNVDEVMTKEVFSCAEDDDILDALATMRERRVRRLPVLTGSGQLAGIVSLDDLVLSARDDKGAREGVALSYAEVARTIQAINQHQLPGPLAH